VESHRQAVQHQDGGIVKDILVKEGSLVSERDVLIRLDATALKADAEVQSSQKTALEALQARLLAERDGLADLVLDDELKSRRETAEAAPAIAGQEALLRSRRRALASQVAVHRTHIEQARQQLIGYEAQLAATRRELEIATDEHSGVAQLLAKGFAPRTRVLALEREIAELTGRIGDLGASIARTRQQIGESEAEIERLYRERDNDVAQQLRDAQNSLGEIAPKLRATLQALSRIELRAPRTGYVVGLSVFNPGSVIRGGDRVLDIVPIDSPLVIETRVRPEDIDQVRVGMKAEVRLTGLNWRVTPIIDGAVTGVSADRMTDERSGESYFQVLVELDPEKVAPVRRHLISGMPALAMFPTRERTALEYLLKPIRDGFDRALRE
jgi:HlyD family type I secretion membrane fusion protein